MSVASGDFIGNGLTFAAGAPRSNETGQVFIFMRTKKNFINAEEMDVIATLNGEQFASSFGYEIASANVNGDQYVNIFNRKASLPRKNSKINNCYQYFFLDTQI